MTKPTTLTDADFIRAACEMRCEVAVIKAVTKKEAPKGGFLPDGQPTILFERHVFRRLTAGRFDESHPHLSHKEPGGYGAAGQRQHDRLNEAAGLDRDAALQSASWGRFQIMGFNWTTCGYPSLQDFINAMYRSEGDHIHAFARFVVNEKRDYPVKGPLFGMRMAEALQLREFGVFACLFNGPNYRINKYDTSLKDFYDKAPAGEKHVPDVKQKNDPMGGAK